MKNYWKRLGLTFPVLFLAFFMLVIFGPAEIFFKNYTELGFVYGEFGWIFLGAGILAALLCALILALFPEILQRIILALTLGVSLAAYLQCMFFNAGVESLGQDANGYEATREQVLRSGIVWLIAILLIVCIAIFAKNWKKLFLGISCFFLAVQLVGYVSLFITADTSALQYSTEEELCFSAEEQYLVSSNENIIYICLDCFSNEYLDEYRYQDDSWRSIMKDFTYYNNADCGCYGTYPSLIHMLTGNPLDITIPVNQYAYESWTNEKTTQYFQMLKDHNYKVNLYVDSNERILGTNSLEILQDKVDNITTKSASLEIDRPLMYKTMIKMSCYRYAPDLIKNRFYVTYDKYDKIASYGGAYQDQYNHEFYQSLVDRGLSVDDSGNNYFIWEHLNGTHEFLNNEYCQRSHDNDRTKTIAGCFYMLDEYFRQLKELGVYDNSTIVVLSDHGVQYNGQPIFFIKEKGVVREEMAETNAFIDYDALVPTNIEALGEDSDFFGNSIYDYKDNEWRERVFMDRAYDENYPDVPRYDGNGNGAANVYHVYHYTGDMWYLISEYQLMHYETVPMVDSYY